MVRILDAFLWEIVFWLEQGTGEMKYENGQPSLIVGRAVHFRFPLPIKRRRFPPSMRSHSHSSYLRHVVHALDVANGK